MIGPLFDDPGRVRPAGGGPDAVIVWPDGGARGNPGPAALGVLITTPDGEVLARIGEYLGVATNNVAEYQALCRGLEEARRLGARRVEIRSDSELLVQQLKGEWKTKDEKLKALRARARQLLLDFSDWQVRHVPRSENTEADAIVNDVLDRYLPPTGPDGPAAPDEPLEALAAACEQLAGAIRRLPAGPETERLSRVERRLRAVETAIARVRASSGAGGGML